MDYFGELGLKYPILVGDASAGPNLERNKQIIRSIGDRLILRHVVCDHANDSNEVLLHCMSQVETAYVQWVADDDFIIPEAMDAAIEFMDHNPSYVAVQGQQILFTTENDDACAPSLDIAPLNMVDFSVEGASAADRVRNRMFQNTRIVAPKTNYSMMRTSNIARIYREVFAQGLDHSNTESLTNQMVLLSGSIMLMERLYIARQYRKQPEDQGAFRAHGRYMPIITQSSSGETFAPLVDTRAGEKFSHPPDFFDLMVDPLFHVKYQRIVDCLARELSYQDGISMKESQELVRYWQWCFLAKSMMPKFHEHFGHLKLTREPAGIRARQWVKRVPGVRKLGRKLRWISGNGLRAAGPEFRGDLDSIYRAVTVRQVK